MAITRTELQDNLRNAWILAPLTKGGNLPFRRLCVEHGADVTVSEMVYARQLVKGEGRERALIRRHPSERCFGVQLAALQCDEALEAGRLVAAAGADFIDINCGCPIDDVTRRGLGAALLRRPKALLRLVEHLVKHLEIPITVKVRTGWSEDSIDVSNLARQIEEAGACALTIHGRTREQRYTKSADWGLIAQIAAERSIPVIGNGDILTGFEARQRLAGTAIAGVMVGRGALIKPWIFSELKGGRELAPSAEERIAIYWKLVQYLKEHFRVDEKGLRRIMGFLPWHFSFFCRYQDFTEAHWVNEALAHPLIQTRALTLPERGLDRLLASSDEAVHQAIAVVLLECESLPECIVRLAERARTAPETEAAVSELNLDRIAAG